MTDKLTISKLNNGYLIEWDEEDSSFDGEDEKIKMIHQAIVIQEKGDLTKLDDTEADEKVAMVELLEHIRDHFGFNVDKWKKNNIVVKYEDRYKAHDGDEEKK